MVRHYAFSHPAHSAAPKSASSLSSSSCHASSLFGRSGGSQLKFRQPSQPSAGITVENEHKEEDFDGIKDVKEEQQTKKVKSELRAGPSQPVSTHQVQAEKKGKKGFQPENKYGALGAAKRKKMATFDLRSKLISKEARAWYLDLMDKVNQVRLALMAGTTPPELAIPDFPGGCSRRKGRASVSFKVESLSMTRPKQELA